MSYGTIKVDTITFTDNSVDKSVSLSGLIQNPTFTGNITVTGTISGDVIRGGTTVSGATVTGTTANFVSGVFTTQISGATVTGTTASFTSGVFTNISGTTSTITSGIIASGTAAAPSLAILADLDTGLFSPGANELAVATNGTRRLLIDSAGALTLDTGDATIYGVRVGRGAGADISNTVVGNGALQANTTGIDNTANGYRALYSNTIGNSNTAAGLQALNANISGNSNTAAGHQALYYNTIGNNNTAAGYRTLFNSTGSDNTANGHQALYSNTTGSNNIGIGKDAGADLTTGSNNTIIGAIAGTAGLANTVIIGAGSTERLRIDSSGNVGVGNSSPATTLDVVGGYFTGGNSRTDTDTKTFGLLLPHVSSATNPVNIIGALSTTGQNLVYIGGSDSNLTGTSATTIHFYTAANATTANGTERMRITAAGLVGVGTSSPQKTFHVLNPGSTYQADLRLGGTSTYYFDLSHDPATTGKTIYNAYALSGTSHGHQFQVAGTNALLIDSSGRVGIGTTSPGYKLDVQDAIHIRVDGSSLANLYFSGTGTRIRYNDGTGNLSFFTNSAERAYVGYGGGFVILNALSVGGDVTLSGGDRSIINNDNNALAFGTNATERARIDSSGRLLVGTSSTSSSALFQVQGNSSSSTGDAIIQLRVGKNNVSILNGNSLGSIQFSNSESTVSAVIEAVADANWNTTNDYPSRLVFSTTADGADEDYVNRPSASGWCWHHL
jgi:hypothetical protein